MIDGSLQFPELMHSGVMSVEILFSFPVFVMILIAPAKALAPNIREEGPDTTSMRSMSERFTGRSNYNGRFVGWRG